MAELLASYDEAVSRNPATGEVVGRYRYHSTKDLDQALARCVEGHARWRRFSVVARVRVLAQLASVLRDRSELMATMITTEMGKPISQARAEIEKCAFLCDWYAKHGTRFLQPQEVSVDKGHARQEFRPLGAILGVMPWNFPIWQVLRGAVSILLAGNSYVLKPAPNVLGCAYLLRDAFEATDLPDGAFEILNITPTQVSQAIADPRIAAIAVTASGRAQRLPPRPAR